MNKCVIPGTFDPIQDGHLNIIKRASKIFDQVVVAVAKSDAKGPKHSLDERVSLATEKCSDLDNVTVMSFDNLLVDFVREQGANCVIRGLRNAQDFEYESNMTAANNKMDNDFETIFMLSDPELKNISSTQIRELESMGIDPDTLTKKTD